MSLPQPVQGGLYGALLASLAALASYFFSSLEFGIPNWQAVGAIFVLAYIAWDCLDVLKDTLQQRFEDPESRRRFEDFSKYRVYRPMCVALIVETIVIYVLYAAANLDLPASGASSHRDLLCDEDCYSVFPAANVMPAIAITEIGEISAVVAIVCRYRRVGGIDRRGPDRVHRNRAPTSMPCPWVSRLASGSHPGSHVSGLAFSLENPAGAGIVAGFEGSPPKAGVGSVVGSKIAREVRSHPLWHDARRRDANIRSGGLGRPRLP